MQRLVISGAIDGVNRTYTVNLTPTCLLLFQDGLLQYLVNDYTFNVSTRTIFFNLPPLPGVILGAIDDPTMILRTVSGTVNGRLRSFGFYNVSGNSSNFVVFLNGSLQLPYLDYYKYGMSFKFLVDPALDSQLVVYTRTSLQYTPFIGLIDGTNALFTYAFPGITNNLTFKNGLYQSPGTDYNVLGNTSTFTVAPAQNDIITTITDILAIVTPKTSFFHLKGMTVYSRQAFEVRPAASQLL
jgi:hypothetical protein